MAITIDGVRAGGGSKLSRSETVTVRLDPKLRYLADLAARKQRRSLSSFIEWAIADSLTRINLHATKDKAIADEAADLWDVDDADRFVKLAFRYPELLTHEEQVRWKLIRENGGVWRGSYVPRGPEKVFTWNIDEDDILLERLRNHWAAFCQVAETGDTAALPTWLKTLTSRPPAPPPAPTSKPSSGFDDMDDDIPF